MNCRRHGSKPTLALWMLVAVADVALIVAATGVLTMLLIAAGLVTVGVTTLVFRQLVRRGQVAESVPTTMTARRRA